MAVNFRTLEQISLYDNLLIFLGLLPVKFSLGMFENLMPTLISWRKNDRIIRLVALISYYMSYRISWYGCHATNFCTDQIWYAGLSSTRCARNQNERLLRSIFDCASFVKFMSIFELIEKILPLYYYDFWLFFIVLEYLVHQLFVINFEHVLDDFRIDVVDELLLKELLKCRSIFNEKRLLLDVLARLLYGFTVVEI